MFAPQVLLVALGLWAVATDEVIEADFRNGIDEAHFALTAQDHSPFVKQDTKGLRIVLQAGKATKTNAIGVKSTFKLRGDFEITAVIETLNLGDSNTRAGASVSVNSATQMASLWSLRRKEGKKHVNRLVANRVYTTKDGTRQQPSQRVPVESKRVSLRLVRKGSELTYHVAEGASKEFRLLHSEPFGTEDINVVRLAADNGGSPALVDVRFERLTVRADKFIQPNRRKPSSWSPWTLGGWGTAGAAALALVYILWRRRQE